MHNLIRSALLKSCSNLTQNGSAAAVLGSSSSANSLNSSSKRSYKVEFDHSNYGGTHGKEIKFNHERFTRPIRDSRFSKPEPKKKFTHEIYYSLEERLKG